MEPHRGRVVLMTMPAQESNIVTVSLAKSCLSSTPVTPVQGRSLTFGDL